MDMIKPFVGVFVYPLMRLGKGNQIKKYLKQLKASESLPSSELAAMQKDKLNRLVDLCVKKVPAYQMEKDADDGSLPARWKTIQPLARDVFRAHPENYLVKDIQKEMLIPASTGGSTDAPVKFFIDRPTVEHYEAARWRGLSWWGIKPNSRSVMLWSSPAEMTAEAQKSYRRKEKWLKNRMILPAHDLSEENLSEHIGFLNRYRPEYIYGFPSALYAFALLIERTGLKLSFKLKIILSTAETLFDFQREVISDAFGCPVVNEYGAKDAGILAYECPEGGLHISCENTLIEVLNPDTLKPVPVGDKGIVATTDLNNFSMPRLRYLVGDVVSLSAKSCPCGRTLPLLEGVEGRLVDMLVAQGGRYVHANTLVRLAKANPSIASFQITQHTPDKATLAVVSKPGASENDLDIFAERARGFLPGVDITLRVVEKIPPVASGKHRYAVREFPLTVAKRMSRALRDNEGEGGTHSEKEQ